MEAVTPLSGGSINHVYLLKTDRGDFCLKMNDAGKHPGMFESEAKGLAVLETAGDLKVPRPVFQATLERHSFLLLEYLTPARPGPGMWHRFGRALARLHRHSAEQYGLSFDNYMGSLPQCNRFHTGWSEFFITERLEPQVRLAREQGFDLRADFESLYPKLDRLFPREKPSLIHGDLWNGNYLVSGKGEAALIDPAVYYGHREADLAMTTLFGGFHGDFYEGYEEEFPLERGWRQRLDLYNLYPLLIHLNLFGSSYLWEIRRILDRY